eukprot:jgi/Botrbrau1/14288/Bobra.0369s0002.1
MDRDEQGLPEIRTPLGALDVNSIRRAGSRIPRFSHQKQGVKGLSNPSKGGGSLQRNRTSNKLGNFQSNLPVSRAGIETRESQGFDLNLTRVESHQKDNVQTTRETLAVVSDAKRSPQSKEYHKQTVTGTRAPKLLQKNNVGTASLPRVGCSRGGALSTTPLRSQNQLQLRLQQKPPGRLRGHDRCSVARKLSENSQLGVNNAGTPDTEIYENAHLARSPLPFLEEDRSTSAPIPHRRVFQLASEESILLAECKGHLIESKGTSLLAQSTLAQGCNGVDSPLADQLFIEEDSQTATLQFLTPDDEYFFGNGDISSVVAHPLPEDAFGTGTPEDFVRGVLATPDSLCEGLDNRPCDQSVGPSHLAMPAASFLLPSLPTASLDTHGISRTPFLLSLARTAPSLTPDSILAAMPSCETPVNLGGMTPGFNVSLETPTFSHGNGAPCSSAWCIKSIVAETASGLHIMPVPGNPFRDIDEALHDTTVEKDQSPAIENHTTPDGARFVETAASKDGVPTAPLSTEQQRSSADHELCIESGQPTSPQTSRDVLSKNLEKREKQSSMTALDLTRTLLSGETGSEQTRVPGATKLPLVSEADPSATPPMSATIVTLGECGLSSWPIDHHPPSSTLPSIPPPKASCIGSMPASCSDQIAPVMHLAVSDPGQQEQLEATSQSPSTGSRGRMGVGANAPLPKEDLTFLMSHGSHSKHPTPTLFGMPFSEAELDCQAAAAALQSCSPGITTDEGRPIDLGTPVLTWNPAFLENAQPSLDHAIGTVEVRLPSALELALQATSSARPHDAALAYLQPIDERPSNPSHENGLLAERRGEPTPYELMLTYLTGGQYVSPDTAHICDEGVEGDTPSTPVTQRVRMQLCIDESSMQCSPRDATIANSTAEDVCAPATQIPVTPLRTPGSVGHGKLSSWLSRSGLFTGRLLTPARHDLTVLWAKAKENADLRACIQALQQAKAEAAATAQEDALQNWDKLMEHCKVVEEDNTKLREQLHETQEQIRGLESACCSAVQTAAEQQELAAEEAARAKTAAAQLLDLANQAAMITIIYEEEKETLLKELKSAKSQLSAALSAVEAGRATTKTTKQHMAELEEQLMDARDAHEHALEKCKAAQEAAEAAAAEKARLNNDLAQAQRRLSALPDTGEALVRTEIQKLRSQLKAAHESLYELELQEVQPCSNLEKDTVNESLSSDIITASCNNSRETAFHDMQLILTQCQEENELLHRSLEDARKALECATVYSVVDNIVTHISQAHQQESIPMPPESMDAACSPLPIFKGSQPMLPGTDVCDAVHDRNLSPMGWALKQAAEFLTDRMLQEGTPGRSFLHRTLPVLDVSARNVLAKQGRPLPKTSEISTVPGKAYHASSDGDSVRCVADASSPRHKFEDDATSRELISTLSDFAAVESQPIEGISECLPRGDASCHDDELRSTCMVPARHWTPADSITSIRQPPKARQVWMPVVPFKGQAASPGGILAFFGAHRVIVNRHAKAGPPAASAGVPVSELDNRPLGRSVTPTASWHHVTSRLNQLRANLEDAQKHLGPALHAQQKLSALDSAGISHLSVPDTSPHADAEVKLTPDEPVLLFALDATGSGQREMQTCATVEYHSNGVHRSLYVQEPLVPADSLWCESPKQWKSMGCDSNCGRSMHSQTPGAASPHSIGNSDFQSRDACIIISGGDLALTPESAQVGDSASCLNETPLCHKGGALDRGSMCSKKAMKARDLCSETSSCASTSSPRQTDSPHGHFQPLLKASRKGGLWRSRDDKEFRRRAAALNVHITPYFRL